MLFHFARDFAREDPTIPNNGSIPEREINLEFQEEVQFNLGCAGPTM
jgi:hypothetical protein